MSYTAFVLTCMQSSHGLTVLTSAILMLCSSDLDLSDFFGEGDKITTTKAPSKVPPKVPATKAPLKPKPKPGET